MQRVLVLSSSKQPLMPCHPARARELLRRGKAIVFRQFPFTIILKDRDVGQVQLIALKLDPGSKQTGMVLVADFQRSKRVIWAATLAHRGEAIKAALLTRRQQRRFRRQRHTRYRPARFLNRKRPEGWLPPSLQSRINNIWTWFCRLNRVCPITSLAQELVRFDTQLMENAEISGIEYQQGELAGYEIREYLLEKWGRKCAYCGAKDCPLQIEHLTPTSRGGSDRVSNLTLACNPCNQRKGAQTAAEFGHPELQKAAKQPLKDAAAVNTTRWALYRQLLTSGLPVEVSTGGRTKFNRCQQGYPKKHWIDAACVGESGAQVFIRAGFAYPLSIQAMGRQRRQLTLPNRFGFPRTSAKVSSTVYGFKTGDLVRAMVLEGKHTGNYIGRVAVRASGRFNLTTARTTLQGISYRYCKTLHASDGYMYQKGDGTITHHA